MAYTVYKHTSPSGKVYIGITSIDPAKRWKQGYSHNKHFSMAIKKYGWENIKSEIIASGLTKNEACEMEIFLIKQYKSTDQNLGYNISTGGECGRAGATFSLESREKMRQSKVGRKLSAEQCRKISERGKGRVVSLETREKQLDYLLLNKKIFSLSEKIEMRWYRLTAHMAKCMDLLI